MENGISEINVNITPLMMAMAVPISFAIQFIKATVKRWSFFNADEIKKSFFPMVSIALTMAAYRLAGIDEWLLAGVVMGLAASGGYQAFSGTAKLVKKPIGTSTLGILLLCFLLLIAGCAGMVHMDPAAKAEFNAFNISAQVWNRKCQADPNACAPGLASMADRLAVWTAIVNGVDPNEVSQ